MGLVALTLGCTFLLGSLVRLWFALGCSCVNLGVYLFIYFRGFVHYS